MASFKDLLEDVRRKFVLENERIKANILELEASLERDRHSHGKKQIRLEVLTAQETKEKTILSLRNDLLNRVDEMEEFQRKLQEILSLKGEETAIKIRREIIAFNKALPVYRFRGKIMESIRDHDVTILAADTGSGKSTLVPQFIFSQDESLVTYCAQPRRLAAHGLAEYSRDCLCLGPRDPIVATHFSPWDTTYEPDSSRVVYTTNFGMIDTWRKDKSLSGIDVIVMDEVHERKLATDLLLGIMKEVLGAQVEKRKKPLKLVLMSATIDPSMFSNYFKEDNIRVNHIFIPGRTFPVEMVYDTEPLSEKPSEYLGRTVQKIQEILDVHQEGDILAFLAAPSEIDSGVDCLEEYITKLRRNIRVFPLHGNVDAESQRGLFKKNKDSKEQRVILATKIAETSVTLPDIMFVVDSGRQKEFTFDLINNIGELKLNKISKTSAIQRAGRAGRVGPGICYRLYEQKDFDAMDPTSSPEVRCLPLDQSLLTLFHLGFSSPSTFEFIDPPNPASIKVGIASLLSLDAISEVERVDSEGESYELTPLGVQMAKFNIDPRLAHLIVNTVSTQKKWIYEVLVICGMVSSGGNMFYRYGDVQAADLQKLKFCHPAGDLITMLEAFKRWTYVPRHEQRTWAKRNFVSTKALMSVKNFVYRTFTQIKRICRGKSHSHLRDHVFAEVESYDTLLKLIYQSFRKSIAVYAGHPLTGYVSPVTFQRMVLHPSCSVNKLETEYPRFICFDKVLTIHKTYIFHASLVKPEWIEDVDALYNDFVKTSLVESHNHYPRIGTKLLSREVLPKFKDTNLEITQKIEANAKKKQVTAFFNIHISWELGLIDTCCHLENKAILCGHVESIIENALDIVKTERKIIPVHGAKVSLNVGLNGIANEIINSGGYLSIRLAMYDLTPEEVKESVSLLEVILESKPRIKFWNPFIAELMFTNKKESKDAYKLILEKFPHCKAKFMDNSRRNETINFRFFPFINQPPQGSSAKINILRLKLGERLAENVHFSTTDKGDVQIDINCAQRAMDIYDKLITMRYHINGSLSCNYIIPSKASRLQQVFPTLKYVWPKITKDGDKTKVQYKLTCRDLFPIPKDLPKIINELSAFFDGISFSRPTVPLFFDSISPKSKIQEIENSCHVAIIQDKYSQEYSLKIYGKLTNAQQAIQMIDEYLSTMEIIVTEIAFKKDRTGKQGLLIQLFKTYGTNLHKLNYKKGIKSSSINLSRGIIRISGSKDAISEVENDIATLFANCPSVVLDQYIDEDQACCICFVAPEKNDTYRFDLCGHMICLHQCFRMLITSSDIPLSCPQESCEGPGISVRDMSVAFSIDPSVKMTFMQNCLTHYMLTHIDIKNCPVIDCRGIYVSQSQESISKGSEVNDDASKTQCDVCYKDICVRCNVEYHKDLTCDMFQSAEKNDIEVFLKKGIIKKCPNCKFPIEKNGGCLLVTCICKACLCWFCLIDYKSPHAVYNHLCPVPR